MKDNPIKSEHNRGFRRIAIEFVRTTQRYAYPPRPAYTVELTPEVISEGEMGEQRPIDLHVDRSAESTEVADGGSTLILRTDIPTQSSVYKDLGLLHTKTEKTRSKKIILASCLVAIFVAGFFSYMAVYYYKSLSFNQISPFLMLAGFVIYLGYQAISAVIEGFKNRPILRVKVGNGYFDFDPKMSDEEFRVKFEEAASK